MRSARCSSLVIRERRRHRGTARLRRAFSTCSMPGRARCRSRGPSRRYQRAYPGDGQKRVSNHPVRDPCLERRDLGVEPTQRSQSRACQFCLQLAAPAQARCHERQTTRADHATGDGPVAGQQDEQVSMQSVAHPRGLAHQVGSLLPGRRVRIRSRRVRCGGTSRTGQADPRLRTSAAPYVAEPSIPTTAVGAAAVAHLANSTCPAGSLAKLARALDVTAHIPWLRRAWATLTAPILGRRRGPHVEGSGRDASAPTDRRVPAHLSTPTSRSTRGGWTIT